MGEIRLWTGVSAVITALAGTLLHFTYQWFGGRVWAYLSPVNESTWEHLKLIFFPLLLMAAVEYVFFGRKIPAFALAKLASALAGMLAIVVIFYTYSGVLGYNFLAADIITFFLGVAAAYAVSYVILEKSRGSGMFSGDMAFVSTCALAGLAALVLLFLIFTYAPPHIAMFKDPVTGYYGLHR